MLGLQKNLYFLKNKNMADFCESCAKEMGFPGDYIFSEFETSLDPEFATSVLCEGCCMTWIGKNENGEMVFGYEDEDQNVVWEKEPRKISGFL